MKGLVVSGNTIRVKTGASNGELSRERGASRGDCPRNARFLARESPDLKGTRVLSELCKTLEQARETVDAANAAVVGRAMSP